MNTVDEFSILVFDRSDLFHFNQDLIVHVFLRDHAYPVDNLQPSISIFTRLKIRDLSIGLITPCPR